MSEHIWRTGAWTKQGAVELRTDQCKICGCLRYCRKDKDSTAVISYQHDKTYKATEMPDCKNIINDKK